MRKLSIVSLFLFLSVFVLLIVSFARPWYHQNAKSLTGSGYIGAEEFYPTKIKLINHPINYEPGYHSYESVFKYEVPIFRSVLNASISFAILGWVCSLAMVILSVLDVLEFKVPPVGKFLGFAVFLFTLLSFLIYLGAPRSQMRDCKNTRSDCDNDIYWLHNGFIGKNDFVQYGPSAGFNVVPIACSISLIASLFNVFFFAKNSA